MPAPRPFILDPLPETPVLGRASVEPTSGSTYDIHGRRHRESSSEEKQEERIDFSFPPSQQLTAAQLEDSRGEAEEETHRTPEEALGLELFDLGDAPHMPNLRWGLPHVGESPRGGDLALSDPHIVEPNVDAAWLRHTLEFVKPDGRDYRLHEKRRAPPPQPILAPSTLAKEIAPAYANAELLKAMPQWKGHQNKHDLVTFLTTGKPLPGPSLAQIAHGADSLQHRLDDIHSTNVSLVTKVEQLWRLKQSWSMQRPDNYQWQSPLERPRVLRKAPGRHFRTNLTLYDLTAAVARDGSGQEGYEITPGTLYRKGIAQIPVAGRWSMFKGEPSSLPEPPPEDFRSPTEVHKEIRRRRPKEEASEAEAAPLETTVDVAKADELMQELLSAVTSIQMDIHGMKKDLAATDPNQIKDDDEEEVSLEEPRTTLVEDITSLQKRLEETNARNNKKTGMGHIYVREGELKEVELHEGMDGGGDDDDLEDLIRKPKMKRPTPHRDCFNPLSRTSVHK